MDIPTITKSVKVSAWLQSFFIRRASHWLILHLSENKKNYKISESKCLTSKLLYAKRQTLTYLASLRKQKNYKIKESKYTKLKIHFTASPTLTYSPWQNPKKISIRTHIPIRVNISIRKISTSKDTTLNAALSVESGVLTSLTLPESQKKFKMLK